jgi:hypothetical protein
MIKGISAQRGKRRRRGWILPGLLGVFLLHPFYADLSHLEHEAGSLLSGEVPPSPPSPAPTVSDPHQKAAERREQKILNILSQSVTGLTDEQEKKLASFIGQESRRYGFDPELIVAVISTESSFYNWSTSSKGALGLMQLIPETGRELAEINNIAWHGDERILFDPFLNIQLGIHYLYTLYLKFGDVELALTAYNYGPGNVFRWLRAGEKIPTKYAKKVLASYEELIGLQKPELKEGSKNQISAKNEGSLSSALQIASRS